MIWNNKSLIFLKFIITWQNIAGSKKIFIFRSKSLLNELETLYDERHEQDETNATSAANDEPIVPVPEGPHMTNEYSDFQVCRH